MRVSTEAMDIFVHRTGTSWGKRMRVTQKRVLMIGLLLSASMVMSGMSVAGPSLQTPTVEKASSDTWTVFVYLDGDNNLEQYAIEDLVEMENVGSDDDLTII